MTDNLEEVFVNAYILKYNKQWLKVQISGNISHTTVHNYMYT